MSMVSGRRARESVGMAILALVVAGGCRDREAAPEAKAAPDTATADTAAVVADSVPDPAAAPVIANPALPQAGSKGPQTGPAARPGDSIIGWDSAFGPIGTVDSAGRVAPIRKK